MGLALMEPTPCNSWLPFVDSVHNELSLPSEELLATINDLPPMSFTEV
jgi:hypothetical protein